MRERLSRRYPLLGIKDQHSLQEINCGGVSVLELVLQGLPFALGQGLDESEGLGPCQ